MEQKEITESNKLIAEFMDAVYEWNTCLNSHTYVFDANTDYRYIVKETDLEYEISWDILMPVVEKIESLGWVVAIIKDRCQIGKLNDINPLISWCIDTKLSAVYSAVIQFITYYNKGKDEA